MKKFIFIGLWMAFLNVAMAGSEGTGGGMLIYKDGEVKTLAEAGILLERFVDKSAANFPKYYTPSNKVKDEVRKILTLIIKKMGHLNLEHNVLAERGTFYEVNEIPAEELQKIQNDYATVLNRYGKYVDESLLVLGAYSKDGKTYVLPDFKKRPPFRQALVLFHEKFMRESTHLDIPTRLALTLEMDAQIFKLIQSSRNLEDFDPLAMILVLQDHGIKELKPNTVMIAHTQAKIGRPLMLSELVRLPPQEINGVTHIEYDPSAIQKFNSVMPYLAKRLEGHALSLLREEMRYNRGSKSDKQLQREVGRYCHANASLLHSDDAANFDYIIYTTPYGLTYAVQCDFTPNPYHMVHSVNFDNEYYVKQTPKQPPVRRCETDEFMQKRRDLDKEIENLSVKKALEQNFDRRDQLGEKLLKLKFERSDMARELIACHALSY